MSKITLKRINMDWDAEDIADEAMKLGKKGFSIKIENMHYFGDDQDYYFKPNELAVAGLQINDLETLCKDISYYMDEEDDQMSGKYTIEHIETSSHICTLQITENSNVFIIKFPC